MTRSLKHLLAFAPLALLPAGFAAGVGEAAAAQPEERVVIPSSSKADVTPPHAGMTSEFYHLLAQLAGKSAGERAKFMTEYVPEDRAFPIVQLRGKQLDEIETYIWLESWDSATLQSLKAEGVEITGEDPERYLVQGWMAIAEADRIASLPGVRHLRRPSYGIPSAGAVVSEGVSSLNAPFIRNLGNVNGLGVRIGVISVGLFNSSFPVGIAQDDGSNEDSRIQSGDLPRDPRSDFGLTSGFFGATRVFPPNFTAHDLQRFPPFFSEPEGVYGRNFPEGAAILETILDIAPGYFQDPQTPREFLYADGRTDIALIQARNWMTQTLPESVRPDIIVDDMVFFDSGRFDGSSRISRQAQQLALDPELNLVYVTAVGNHTPYDVITGQAGGLVPANSPIFINGNFSPVDNQAAQRFHNFASGNLVGFRDETLGISPQGGVIDVALVWDDIWDDQNPRAKKDLDLYLVPLSNPAIDAAVASSTDLQNGSGRPIERITASLTGGNLGLVIARKDNRDVSSIPFTLVILQGAVHTNNGLSYVTHGVPLNNADAPPPVISVGAIDATRGVNTMAPTSIPGLKPGPGRNLSNSFFRWYGNQKAPAVVNYSNTRSRSAPVFSGSSAAAAHVGGLLRLLRHAYPEIPGFEWYNILTDTRIPLHQPFPNASPINAADLAPYANRPTYLRVNGFDTWANLRDQFAEDPTKAIPRVAYVPTHGDLAAVWEKSDGTHGFNEPVFSEGTQGLTISPGGEDYVFGYLQTPVLEFGAGEERTHRLDADKYYELTVRVGCDEPDPLRVPHFRLRFFSTRNDESTMYVAASLNPEADNMPTTISGREYRLLYSPSSQDIADHGVRFAFDLIHFDPNDNSDATFFIHEVTLRELP